MLTMIAGRRRRRWEDDTELKLTPLRRIIAENMIKSNEIPQAWSYHEVDVTNLVILRKNIRQQFIQKEGVDITYLPFVIHSTHLHAHKSSRQRPWTLLCRSIPFTTYHSRR